jgi:hypothetical protein
MNKSTKRNQKSATQLKAEAIHAKENAAAERRGYDGPTLPHGANTLIGWQHLTPYERRSTDVHTVTGVLDLALDDETPVDRKYWASVKAKAKARIDADPEAKAMLRETRREQIGSTGAAAGYTRDQARLLKQLGSLPMEVRETMRASLARASDVGLCMDCVLQALVQST